MVIVRIIQKIQKYAFLDHQHCFSFFCTVHAQNDGGGNSQASEVTVCFHVDLNLDCGLFQDVLEPLERWL